MQRQRLELKLDSESAQERHAAVQSILKARDVPHANIRALADKYIASGTRVGTVKDAMIVLGRLGATEQIPWLVDNLTFAAFYKETKRLQSTEDYYPAVRALIEMGPPAIEPVLARLARDDNPDVQIAGAAVLKGVLGRVEAAERLKSAMAATKDTKTRTNFKAVLDRLPRA